MKKILTPLATAALLSLVMAAAVMLSIALAPEATTADNGYDKQVILENKTGDPNWTVMTGDGISATLNYNSSGSKFAFSLNGKVKLSNTAYSLIYYADPYPGNNPGALLGTGISNADGTITITDDVELGMNVPAPPDANIGGDYCTRMCGGYPCNPGATVCSGAKIWLVPSGDYNAETKSMIAWNVPNILFDTDLINYIDTDIASGSEVTLTTTIPAEMICISATPNAFNFGEMRRGQCKEQMNVLTVTNCGDIPITVTAVVSGNLYSGGNLDISHGAGWTEIPAWSYPLAVGASKTISLKLCVPLGYSAGTATGSLTFIATP